MYARFPLSSNWDEMDRLQREMNRLFDEFYPSRRPVGGYPAVNLWVGENEQVVTAELPGINLNDLEINVLGTSLTITGERSTDDLARGCRAPPPRAPVRQVQPDDRTSLPGGGW